MNDNTLLLRQIHPSFVRNGKVTSQAFRPTPKDEGKLSCDDGDQITAENSWRRYTETLGLGSLGVLAVSVNECQSLKLPVDPDGVPYPEHVSILFEGLSNRQREKRAKRLRAHANLRGWLHGPS